MVEKIIKTVLSSEFCFFIAGLIIFLNCIKKNNNFFDIRNIFIEQFKMFSDARKQIIVFYVVPFILTIAVMRNKYIDKDIVDTIITMLSIIISMSFAMLSILNSYKNKNDSYTKVLNETYNTIMFQCILCVLALIISFSYFFIAGYNCEIVSSIISFTLYYLVFTIILNVFIILKRMKALYDNR